ncbi:MAG: hypothetical protein OJF49_003412 [Ktedonobacterales bacterium]|jgi:excisionase family DNA binding protein|nr:MAG: hypothetical protein OJF49_003412 [Ktedonobacterales bacterium]
MSAELDLTVEEVARRLGIAEESVRRYLRSGKLRGYRAGGVKAGWRVQAQDLEAFKAARMNIALTQEERPAP